MPRLIFKCPYIKGGTSSATAHLENYVKYMATRNGVERIDPGRSEWPATSKQKKMVEQILRDFPLSRGMFEYEDYAAEPTRTNASEFITRALEDNYNQIAKKDRLPANRDQVQGSSAGPGGLSNPRPAPAVPERPSLGTL